MFRVGISVMFVSVQGVHDVHFQGQVNQARVPFLLLLEILNTSHLTLTGMAQLIGCHTAKQKVAGSIPSQGICLDCGLGPQLGACKWQWNDVSHTDFSFSFLSSLSKNNLKKKKPNTPLYFFLSYIYPLGYPGYSFYLKVCTLNHICKLPFTMYGNIFIERGHVWGWVLLHSPERVVIVKVRFKVKGGSRCGQ